MLFQNVSFQASLFLCGDPEKDALTIKSLLTAPSTVLPINGSKNDFIGTLKITVVPQEKWKAGKKDCRGKTMRPREELAGSVKILAACGKGLAVEVPTLCLPGA